MGRPGQHPRGRCRSYHWHQPLAGSEYALSKAVAGLLNGVSFLLGRRTRFEFTLAERAKIDFAVAEQTADYELKLYAAEGCDGFVGLRFAGSDQASFFCKAEHVRAVGWTPIDKTIEQVDMGETINKIGRTTKYTSSRVTDDSAYGRVNYGDLSFVEFDDVILTTAMLQGGDTVSAGWKSITRTQ